MTIDKNIRLLKKGEVEEKRRRGEREEQLFPFFYKSVGRASGGKEEDYKPPDRGCCL